MEKANLAIHSHPLSFSSRFQRGSCQGCGVKGYFYGSYSCNKLCCDNAIFHMECVHSLPEINHPAHRDHPLVLDLNVEGNCNLCRQELQRLVVYHCSTCDFKLDLVCAKKPPSLSIERPNLHEHPLVLASVRETLSFKRQICKVCDGLHFGGLNLYICLECKIFFHIECVELFPEVHHTSHPKHPLKFIIGEVPLYSDGICVLCGLRMGKQLYHCDVCNYSICKDCAKDPPPLEVVISATHEHQLHLVPRQVIFTCNACGTQGNQSPYFCLQCNFMIHRDCIGLPRIININRHDHRISYTCYLGPGNWKCGVCRQKMDGYYGAYVCLKCPSYAVHSRCAIRDDVWDKIDLEGVPEDEELVSFEVVDENTIKHFSHDHNLTHNNDGSVLGEEILCKACALQVSSDSVYSCKQCDFVLHEKCVNLPRRKPHVFYTRAFLLYPETRGSVRRATTCSLCHQSFNGFRYVSDNRVLDLRCGSIAEPLIHESHPHPLYYDKNEQSNKKCVACGVVDFTKMLTCDECIFSLHFKCALLPKMVMRHRYDHHPLSLSYGENDLNVRYWCDVCENRLDPKVWFYTCDDCVVTLHVSCVVGDLSFHIPGDTISNVGRYEMVPNTSVSRPVCYQCGFRCTMPFIIKFGRQPFHIYFCSEYCFSDT